MTSPLATVSLWAVVMVPTTNRAATIAAVAAACVSPMTLGTGTGAGPDETVRSTAPPGTSSVAATGFWLRTRPVATVSLYAVVTVPTTKRAATIAVVAAACVCPTTSGTGTGAGPDETVRSTALPGTSSVVAAGLWVITSPLATVSLCAVVTVPTTKRAPTIAVVAAACVSPTTLGTGTGAGPDETVRLTALPGTSSVAATGFWLRTSPLATVSLWAVVTVPTTKRAPTIAVVAAACVCPTTSGTGTGAGPDETVRLTALPGTSS